MLDVTWGVKCCYNALPFSIRGGGDLVNFFNCFRSDVTLVGGECFLVNCDFQLGWRYLVRQICPFQYGS